MQMLFNFLHPTSAQMRAAYLVAALALVGCAAKNPLMEESVAVAPTATKPAAAAPSAPVASANDKTANGVETGRQRRFLGFLTPYRVDVQQGNFVSGEMVAQVKPGMTADQVRFVLGTPLLNDMFHAERWDYPFRLEKGNGQTVSSRVTVHFKDSRVASIDGGGALPTEQDYLTLIAGTPPASKAVPAAAAVPATK